MSRAPRPPWHGICVSRVGERPDARTRREPTLVVQLDGRAALGNWPRSNSKRPSCTHVPACGNPRLWRLPWMTHTVWCLEHNERRIPHLEDGPSFRSPQVLNNPEKIEIGSLWTRISRVTDQNHQKRCLARVSITGHGGLIKGPRAELQGAQRGHWCGSRKSRQHGRHQARPPAEHRGRPHPWARSSRALRGLGRFRSRAAP